IARTFDDAAPSPLALGRTPLAMLARAVMCGNRAKFWNAMPMPRRSGAAPTIEFPATRISPSSGSNMPAIMRSRTVLPLPDGPNTATISPGSTTSERSLAGRVAPNALPTDLSSSRAIASAFHRAQRQPFDQIALRVQREQQGRRHGQNDRRGDLAILNPRGRDECKRNHRHGLFVGGGEDQREHEIVPAEDEREKSGSSNARSCQRDGDARERLPPRMSGQAIGMLDIGTDVFEIYPHDPQDQGERDQLINPDDAEVGVVQAELLVIER